MKLLHIYPALAAILDAPRTKSRLTTINGHKAAVWEAMAVWMDTKTRTSRTREHYTSDYWLELIPDSGIFHNIGGADNDEHMVARLATLPAGKFDEFMSNAREVASDTNAYNAAVKERIEQRRAQAAIEAQSRETARKEREALQAVEREKELSSAASVSNGLILRNYASAMGLKCTFAQSGAGGSVLALSAPATLQSVAATCRKGYGLRLIHLKRG